MSRITMEEYLASRGVADSPTSGAAYRGFQVAVREATAQELDQPPCVDHVLSVALTPYRVESRFEGRDHAASLTVGQVSAIPAGSSARWRFPRPAAALHLRFAPSAVEGRPTAMPWTLDLRDERVAALGRAMLAELVAGMPSGRLFGEGVRDALAARFAGATERIPAGGLGGAALTRTMDLMRARIAEELSLDDLAAAAGYSTFHFARLFRASVGEPPHACLVRLRVERAMELLRTTPLSVTAVAAEVGFADAGHLARHFRRRYGIAPREARIEQARPETRKILPTLDVGSP